MADKKTEQLIKQFPSLANELRLGEGGQPTQRVVGADRPTTDEAKRLVKLFPSIAGDLREGPSRAAELHIRSAAIRVADGAPPVNDGEAQIHAEFKRLGPQDRAFVLQTFPLVAEELERHRAERRPESRTEKLAKEFPSLAAELKAGK